MADISLSAAVDTTEVATGMATIRNEAAQLGSDISSILAQSFAATAVIASLNSVIDFMHQIQHEAERFNVDTDALQQISIAAQDSGLSIEQVARALNLATIAGVQAAAGNKTYAAAFQDLNINVQEYNALDPASKIVAVAKAFLDGSQSAQDYAAVAKILGQRFGTELIPAFEGIVEAAKNGTGALDIFSKQELAAGDAAYKLEQQLWRFVQVDFLAPIIKGIFIFGGYLVDAAQAASDLLGYLARIVQLDFKGAAAYGANLANVLTMQGPGHQGVQNILNPPPSTTTGTSAGPGGGLSGTTFSAPGGGGGGAAGSANADAKELESILQEQEKTMLAQLDDQDRLDELTSQRADIAEQLAGLGDTTLDNIKEQLDLNKKLAGLDAQIVPLKKQIQDATNQQAIAEQKGVDAADRAIQKSKERQAIDQLDLLGQTEAGNQLKIASDYEDKIQAALDKANEARAKGLTETADENDKLAQQLEQEKELALIAAQIAALKQIQADIISSQITLDEKKGLIDSATAQLEQQSVNLQYKSQDLANQINAAYATGNVELAQTLEIQKQITDQLQEQAQNEAYAHQLQTVGLSPGQLGTNQLGILAQEGGQFGATSDVYAAALAASEGLKPGSDAYKALVARIEAQDQLLLLQGKNLSFADQLARNQLVQWYDAQQQQKDTLAANIQLQQEIAYWEAIAQGLPPPAGNPYTAYFNPPIAVPAAVVPAPAPTATAAPGSTAADSLSALQSQTDLLQKAVDSLQRIQKNTTLVQI